jgi:hypothetical protein
MKTTNKMNSRFERFAAAFLLLVATAVSAQNLLHWAKVAERRELNAAAQNYSAVKGMYERNSNSNSPATMHLIATNDSSSDTMPGR